MRSLQSFVLDVENLSPSAKALEQWKKNISLDPFRVGRPSVDEKDPEIRDYVTGDYAIRFFVNKAGQQIMLLNLFDKDELSSRKKYEIWRLVKEIVTLIRLSSGVF